MLKPCEAFVHDHALVETESIGSGTRVWAFAHVMAGARIGRDCNICDHTYIEGEVVIGDRVTIKSGVFLWDGLRIEDDVFIGPHATFTNDRYPRSKQPFECPTTVIRRGASIGAGAIILPGLIIGESAMVGAGAVVTKDVPAYMLVVGNPARVTRRVDVDRVLGPVTGLPGLRRVPPAPGAGMARPAVPRVSAQR